MALDSTNVGRTNVSPKQPGDPILARDFNAIAEAAGLLSAGPTGNSVSWPIMSRVLPASECPSGTDYTDERYYIQPIYITNNDGNGTARLGFGDIQSYDTPRTATNLAEANIEEDAGGHMVPPQSIVRAWGVLDTAPDPADRRVHYVFWQEARTAVIKIKTVSGSSYPRTYTAVRYWNGLEYGPTSDAQNEAESDYTNTNIAGSYRPFQVNDLVLGWWDYENQRLAFREFRILGTDGCD